MARSWLVAGSLAALGATGVAACDGTSNSSPPREEPSGLLDGGLDGDGAGDPIDADAGADAETGPPLPPTIQLRAVSFNICGGQCNAGKATALDAAYTRIDAFGPHVVLLQEVCWSQYQAFAQHYAGRYEASFATILKNYRGCGETNCSVNDDEDPTNDNPRCWFGPMLAVRGSLIDPKPVPLGGNANQVNGDKPVVPAREFFAACAGAALVDLPTRNVRACSAHFRAFQDPNGVNDAARLEQATNLTRYVAADVATGAIVVLGGDLNAPPTKASMNPFYALDAPGQNGTGLYFEADQDDERYYADYCAAGAKACRSGAVTHGALGTGASAGTQKYDYVFFSETSSPASVSGLPIDVATSDHAFYRAAVDVATAAPAPRR